MVTIGHNPDSLAHTPFAIVGVVSEITIQGCVWTTPELHWQTGRGVGGKQTGWRESELSHLGSSGCCRVDIVLLSFDL